MTSNPKNKDTAWVDGRQIARLLICWCALLLLSCATEPERTMENTGVSNPKHWSADRLASGSVTKRWVGAFSEPKLMALVQTALNNNYDLKAAAARVKAARELAVIEGSGRWPQLSFTPGYQSYREPDADFSQTESGAFEVLFNLSWEIDLWGRIRSAQQAFKQEADAQAADFYGAQLSLAARTAQTWFELSEAALQADVAEQSIKDRRTIVELVRGRFNRGLTRGLDLRLVLTDLASSEAQLAESRNQIQLLKRQLETLLGRYPDASFIETAKLPELPAVIPAGLPSELLARRPDLVAAFARLRAMDSRLDSAKKALLPRVTLTASGGTRSSALADLVDPKAVAWNLAMGLMQPIFTGGRLIGEIRLNEALTEAALNQYRNTVLNAFREVEQALAAEQWLRAQEKALAEAVAQTEESRKLAVYSYRQGLIEILTLLDSYRSTLNAQSAHLTVKRQLLNNRTLKILETER
ncbi:MAG: efflux transporter outer membrane subunit [Methylovulum sp.]